MRKIKKIVAAAMVATMAFSSVGCKLIQKTPEAIQKTVLAKVGSEEITLGDVDNELKADIEGLKEQYGEDWESKIDDNLKATLKQVREQVLNSLVDEKILLKKGEELNLVPSQEELDKEVETRTNELIGVYGSEEKLAEAKTYYGYTDETFNAFLENQIKTQKVRDELVKDITVTDEEIDKYYEDNKDKMVNSGEAETRHLLFTTEEEAKAVSDKIKSGEATFDQLFAEYEPNKAKRMASDATEEDKNLPIAEDLGKVSHNQQNFDPAFLEGLKPLKEGEVSEPVKGMYGYHVIEAKAVKESSAKEYNDELKEELRGSLEASKKQEAYKTKIEELRTEYGVKLYTDRL